MSFRDDSTPDIFLTHSGGTMGFYLYEDPQQPNVRQWLPSFLPENVNQQQIGAQTYDDRPKTVSQPLAFEDWSFGCGVGEDVAGTTKPKGYSYSRGVDASWAGGICLSPQAQSITGIAEAVVKFYYSPTYGMFALTATHIYKLTAGEWVVCVYTPAATPTDILEYGNSTATYLFLAMGDSTNAVYSTDSFATATPISGAGLQVSFWAVRGNTSVEPVLWSSTVAGLARTSTNPVATATWSNVDRVGSSGQHVTSMVVANDLVYFLKQEGIYAFDGTNIEQILSTDMLNRSNNGKGSFVWVNGFIYMNYGNRVLRLNPYTNETSRIWAPENPELNGTVTAITADLKFLYAQVQNVAGDTYVVKVDLMAAELAAAQNTVCAPHTLAYLPAITSNAAIVVPAGVGTLHATNDVLMFATGTTAQYYILPRNGYRPWEDSFCRFELTGGTIYSPWIDAGAMNYEKWLNAGRITGINLTGAQSLILQYGIDGDDTTLTTVTTAYDDGTTAARVTSEVTFGRIRSAIVLATGDNAHTPRAVGALLDCTPNPPRHRVWNLILDLGDQESPRSGGSKRPLSFKRILSHLFASVGRRVTYTDYFGATYLTKVINVELKGIKRKPTGQGRAQAQTIAQLTIVEIDENQTVDDPFVWGDAAGVGGTPWAAGYEWSPA